MLARRGALAAAPTQLLPPPCSSVSEIFNPDYKDKQLKLCDHVNLWSQNLSQTLVPPPPTRPDAPAALAPRPSSHAAITIRQAELMAWKDDVFELSVLPLNMLSQLVIISSRLARGKGEMLPPLHEAMSLTRSFITGKVVNQEVEVLKATLIRQSNELELETMRRVEAERKLKLATAQVIKLRADAKIFRWARTALPRARACNWSCSRARDERSGPDGTPRAALACSTLGTRKERLRRPCWCGAAGAHDGAARGAAPQTAPHAGGGEPAPAQRAAAAGARARTIQSGTRVLISLWDSLMFGRVPKTAQGFGYPPEH